MSDELADRPFTANGDGFDVSLSGDERAMLCRLVSELRDLVNADDPDDETVTLTTRLFPVVHADDGEAEAEYQRLMRDELIASRSAAFDTVDQVLGDDAQHRIDEGRMLQLMQSINAVRLVLGTMLQIDDEPDAPEVMPGFENSREYHLYGYLSWLLECAVDAMSSA